MNSDRNWGTVHLFFLEVGGVSMTRILTEAVPSKTCGHSKEATLAAADSKSLGFVLYVNATPPRRPSGLRTLTS